MDSVDGGVSIQEFIESKLVKIYVNEFSQESVKDFYEEFMRSQFTGQTIVPIIIDSPGGSGVSLSAMMDIIEGSSITVATIAIGQASSAGAILLSCGSEGFRFASPGSSIMIHPAFGWAAGKEQDVQAAARELSRMQKNIYQRMAKNCKQNSDYFIDLIKETGNTELYMTPYEAKNHNIVNHVKLPFLYTDVEIFNEMK